MKNTIKELRAKTGEELKRLYGELCGKRQELNFKAASKQLKSVRDIRAARKTIAQILTLMKEKGEKI